MALPLTFTSTSDPLYLHDEHWPLFVNDLLHVSITLMLRGLGGGGYTLRTWLLHACQTDLAR